MGKSIVPKKQQNSVLCDGCNVRGVHEHRCHGEGCDCDELTCQVQQGKISSEEAGKIARKALKKENN